MIYYLVCLFDDVSYKAMESLQKAICKKYNLYGSYTNLPLLHITIETIDDPDLQTLDISLRNILKDYTKFQVEIKGAICFDPPYKSVNLNIENKGTIYELSKNINSILKSQGFKVRQDIENWNLHISLASTTFADREWSDNEYFSACELLKYENFNETITINAVELLKPINDKNQMIVKRYDL
ncbi:2'-5' RNA ligase family protein [Clostridium sp. CS001]|uniref:2'-5' RNA ligase family protein n=1 Tax=Clostridium sp. CS001 TaxID=2880648 RepID=UPI001CF39845|nr:2'-5' RNA ligase family protein [Clostridium sp. CS001]MCB2290373.1 2'-5' RNA ligase family protein [Clostridium sp. CS001]